MRKENYTQNSKSNDVEIIKGHVSFGPYSFVCFSSSTYLQGTPKNYKFKAF